MSGEDFQEEAVLAAVKPLKTDNSTMLASKIVASGHSSPRDAQSEDSAGLEALFQEHNDRVFRTAHRVTGSAADAEDVLQTVFLRLARGPESPEISENAESYFARAAINASLDLLRSRKRSKIVAVDDLENRAAAAAFVFRHD